MLKAELETSHLLRPFLVESERLLWTGHPRVELRYYFPQYAVLLLWYIPFVLILIACLSGDPLNSKHIVGAIFSGLFVFFHLPITIFLDFKLCRNIVFGLSNKRLFSFDKRKGYPATIDLSREASFHYCAGSDDVGDVYISSSERWYSLLQFNFWSWRTPSGRKWFRTRYVQPLGITRIKDAATVCDLCRSTAGAISSDSPPIGPCSEQLSAIETARKSFFRKLKNVLLLVCFVNVVALLALVLIFLVVLFFL